MLPSVALDESEWAQAETSSPEGWSSQEPQESPEDDNELDVEDWIADDPEYVNPVKTVKVEDALRAQAQNPLAWLAAVVLAVGLLVGASFVGSVSDDDSPVASTTPSAEHLDGKESLESAAIWHKSALESMDNEDYDLAQDQFAKTIEFLEAGGADRAEIVDVKKQLARVLSDKGALIDSYKMWEEIAEDDQSQQGHLVDAEQALLQRADELLTTAEASLQEGEAGPALRMAKESAEIGNTFAGNPKLKARAYHIMGQAYAFQGDVSAAAESFRRAQQFVFTAQRKEIIAKLNPRSSSNRRSKKSRPKLRLGNEHVPRAKKREKTKIELGDQVELDLDKTASDTDLDLDESNQEKEPTRLGDRDVLSTYNNSSRNAGKPKGL